MSYLGNLIDDFGTRFKDFDVSTDAGKTIAKRYINKAAQWVYVSHPWEWRFRMGQITLIPNYTTGACAVTKYNQANEAASRTVTFSGSTLTSFMKGRFFKVQKSNGTWSDDWHKIENVDATNNQIVLETPILDDSGSGLNFKIWKRFYYLPNDVAAITDFGKWNSRFGRLEYKSFSNLADQRADISDDGTPESFSPFGIDRYETIYSSGTISGTKNTNVVTGSGSAAWLGNVLPGDEIIQGSNAFTVKRIQNDQSLVLNNYLPDDIPASSSYSIRRNLSFGFQFFPNEMDNYLTVPYYFYDRIFNMVNEMYDRPQLPDDFDDAILTRAEFKFKKDKQDNNWIAIAQLFKSELDDLKINFRVARPRYDIFAPETRGYPGR